MTAYERLEWVIPEVQPEVWDIIMVFKKAAEERDRKIAEAKFEADRLEGFKTYNDIRQEKQLFKWKRMNMTDLKKEMKSKGMAVSGTKLDLVQRLALHKYIGGITDGLWFSPRAATYDLISQEAYDLLIKCEVYVAGGYRGPQGWGISRDERHGWTHPSQRWEGHTNPYKKVLGKKDIRKKEWRYCGGKLWNGVDGGKVKGKYTW